MYSFEHHCVDQVLLHKDPEMCELLPWLLPSFDYSTARNTMINNGAPDHLVERLHNYAQGFMDQFIGGGIELPD